MDFGLQVYSVRDIAEKNYREALRRVAEIGYTKLECGDFFGNDPKQIREWADEFGLEYVSAHCGFEKLDEDYKGIVTAVKDLGAKLFTVPWAYWLKPEFMDENIAKLNKYQKMLEQDGLELQFHCHWDEYAVVDGRTAIDEMYEKTNTFIQVDTCWAHTAGKDPVEIIKKYGDRIKTVHLKDCYRKEVVKEDEDEYQGCALGKGIVPIANVVSYLRNTNILPIVESEGLNPDGITEVTNCYNYINKD